MQNRICIMRDAYENCMLNNYGLSKKGRSEEQITLLTEIMQKNFLLGLTIVIILHN